MRIPDRLLTSLKESPIILRISAEQRRSAASRAGEEAAVPVRFSKSRTRSLLREMKKNRKHKKQAEEEIKEDCRPQPSEVVSASFYIQINLANAHTQAAASDIDELSVLMSGMGGMGTGEVSLDSYMHFFCQLTAHQRRLKKRAEPRSSAGLLPILSALRR